MGRQAVTELELDAVAADVLNHNDLSEGGMNPGLKVLFLLSRRFIPLYIGFVGGGEGETGQTWVGGVLRSAIVATQVLFCLGTLHTLTCPQAT